MSNSVRKLWCVCGFEIPTLGSIDQDYYCPQCKGRATIRGVSFQGPPIEVRFSDGYNIARAEVEAMDWPDTVGG